MGKSAAFEGSAAVVETLQAQQCHPKSSLEVWRSGECESALSSLSAAPSSKGGWEAVGGLETSQLKALQKVASQGVLWTHPSKPSMSVVYTLHHGGEVEADGNCLFTAFHRAMQLQESPLEVRLRTVQRFQKEYEASTTSSARAVDAMISHLYSPDLSTGWGVHVVQDVKLLATKADREASDTAIEELLQVGMSKDAAAESVYKERCQAVDDGASWAKYMSITGSCTDEFDIITLQYTEDGLLSVDANREGRAAAFGDDIAIQCLASEYEREVFVVQAHGGDAMVETTECLFFLPHRPKNQVRHPPVFLFMKGTSWCGAGADHYEPIFARVSQSREKAAFVL